jgi:hypothetical protein
VTTNHCHRVAATDHVRQRIDECRQILLPVETTRGEDQRAPAEGNFKWVYLVDFCDRHRVRDHGLCRATSGPEIEATFGIRDDSVGCMPNPSP